MEISKTEVWKAMEEIYYLKPNEILLIEINNQGQLNIGKLSGRQQQ